MQSKLLVTLVRSKAVDNSSDLNKMTVHLEQILAEKDGVDVKVKQSLTDAMIKSSSCIVFCGFDSGGLSEFFKTLSVIEAMEGNEGPYVFLYEEPGQSVWEKLNEILTSGVDLGRVNPKVFNRIYDCWSYRDITGVVDVKLKSQAMKASEQTKTTPAAV